MDTFSTILCRGTTVDEVNNETIALLILLDTNVIFIKLYYHSCVSMTEGVFFALCYMNIPSLKVNWIVGQYCVAYSKHKKLQVLFSKTDLSWGTSSDVSFFFFFNTLPSHNFKVTAPYIILFAIIYAVPHKCFCQPKKVAKSIPQIKFSCLLQITSLDVLFASVFQLYVCELWLEGHITRYIKGTHYERIWPRTAHLPCSVSVATLWTDCNEKVWLFL